MRRLNFLLVFVIVNLSPFYSKAQQPKYTISAVEQIDEDLIGKRLKKAVKLLGLDTNFRVISEPPGKYRGVRSLEIEGWQVQLIIKKTLVNRRIKSKDVYAGIKGKRIIGVSWMSTDKCDSTGEVIYQHAYNRFGPCY